MHKRDRTVVIHVFVDVVLRREDLAHGRQKRLQHKIQFVVCLSQVEGDSRLQISVFLIICGNVIVRCSLPETLVLQITCFIMKIKKKYPNK